MKIRIILLCVFLLPFTLYAQNNKETENEVIAVIKKMFDGMRKGDSAMVSATFHLSIRFQTMFINGKSGKSEIRTENSAEGFLSAVGTPHPAVWDERIESYEVKIDANMATVWTPYEFYAGDKFSHCGVNTFTLFKSDKAWQITHIADTRRNKGCKGNP